MKHKLPMFKIHSDIIEWMNMESQFQLNMYNKFISCNREFISIQIYILHTFLLPHNTTKHYLKVLALAISLIIYFYKVFNQFESSVFQNTPLYILDHLIRFLSSFSWTCSINTTILYVERCSLNPSISPASDIKRLPQFNLIKCYMFRVHRWLPLNSYWILHVELHHLITIPHYTHF